MTTVKSATFAFLREVGVARVFGNPGSTELPFLQDWPADIAYVLALQEASCVAMADGYAQATRNAGFVNLHSAAGVGHALGNLFTAYRNQTPLVIVAGQQARSLLPMRPFLFSENATEFPKPYVKWSVEPARAKDVPNAIATAYRLAMQPPCGPCFVSVPADDWARPADPVRPRRVARELGPDPAGIREIADALAASRKPAIVLGPGVDRDGAVDLAVALAERAQAAVWASPFSMRASFPERHPLFAGFLQAGPPMVAEALAPYDLVLVVGAPVFTFHVEGECRVFDDGPALFQITDNALDAAAAAAGTSLVATMRPALQALLDLVPASDREAPRPRPEPERPAATSPMTAEFVLDALSRALPPDAVLVEEAPSHRPAMQRHLPLRGADSFFTMSSGGLGYSLPAAVGVALGKPGQRVVCLIGDGSAMYSIQALWTAAQQTLPISVVVLNNAGYGAMRAFGRMAQAGGTPGIDLPGLDLVRIAQGFGLEAARIADPGDFAPALERALRSTGPVLLDVVVDAEVPMLYHGGEAKRSVPSSRRL
jgi:benzoylformate decarboxylase